ncbi:glycosyltransferase family 92 protein [Treponema bryantii]|uniref:glycosyltransferase family 92 protein n=1 Tax=Treponema bryantii TaxID=163 RepID=UPI0003B49DC4|nr:glycosyltransferase family 92 protein [Treponema bryantii]
MQKENKYFIFDNPHKIGLKRLIKDVLIGPVNIFYSLKFAFCHVMPEEKKYKISICAIFKNEALYLKEWIEYHKIVGVEHFYLYNNNSEDNYETVLAPYISDGTVTLIQWPQNQAQMQCYHDGIERFKNETEWLSFIDIDEFIVPNSTDNIYEFLKPFQKKFPVVIAYWKMFGTGGMLSRDTNGLVTKDLTVSWNKYTDIGKVFFNTAFNFNKYDKRNGILHHYCWGKKGKLNLPPVNIFGKICILGKNPIPLGTDSSIFPLQINHYFTKTYDEYLQKKAKGDVYFKINPHDEEYFYEHEMKNQSVDYKIYKYLVKLELALKK